MPPSVAPPESPDAAQPAARAPQGASSPGALEVVAVGRTEMEAALVPAAEQMPEAVQRLPELRKRRAPAEEPLSADCAKEIP